MISFIVIGKNEGWKLVKCFNSIVNTIKYNNITNFEIIYIDSNSTDGSIEVAKRFPMIRVFLLTDEKNAAIARNLGAEKSTGEILFFIDGDMEIEKESFSELFDDDNRLKYDFVSGDFRNFYYDNRFSEESISNEMYHKNTKIIRTYTTGGLFVIKKNTWELVGGMRNVFFRSQDMDLGLRLSKKNIYLYRLPISLAKHHTVNYRDSKRLWDDLRSKNHLYARSLLYRKNLLNLNMYKVMYKQDYSFAVLCVVIFLAILLFNPLLFLIYLFVIVIRSWPRKSFSYVLYFFLRDTKVLFGFLFFFPKVSKISFQEI